MKVKSRPHGLQPTSLLRPWDFPGKSTGVGWHFLQVNIKYYQYSGLPRWWLVVKNPLAHAGGKQTQVQPLGWQNPLEESMPTHSSILAWRIPWTEEPGGLHPWGYKELDTTEQLRTS